MGEEECFHFDDRLVDLARVSRGVMAPQEIGDCRRGQKRRQNILEERFHRDVVIQAMCLNGVL